MSVQRPTADTHGLFCPDRGIRVNLRGIPLRASLAAHDPAHEVSFIAGEPAYGPGGQPLAAPDVLHCADRIELELNEVPAWQFNDFEELVERHRGAAIRYSALGETEYGEEDWWLSSTTASWVEERHGIWSGRVVLRRKGEAV